METIIFATSNEHKLSEIRYMLHGKKILGLKDIDIHEEIPETGATLEENAIIKAKFLFEKTGKPSLAEDTGLEVSALSGAPGVHTARYAGEKSDPAANINLLLQNLNGISDRTARFRTIIAFISESETRLFEGIINGTIALEKSGTSGFGYDPIFIPDGYEHTFGELSQAIKNKISHRAMAVKKMYDWMTHS